MITGKTKILFVDDEAHFLDSLKRFLRHYEDQWDMYFAMSTDEALALTEVLSFDAIISDVQMPGRNGFDLLSILREQKATKNIPVVILTGSVETGLKRQALELGATDLLNKPVNSEDLVARIKSVLLLKSYQDKLRKQNELLEEKVQQRTAELELLHRDIIWRLAKAGELRDDETGDHVIRVALHSRILARGIGFSQDEENLIFLTAPLHDVGKIGISDTILLKPGLLSIGERKIMETHCEIGSSILLESPKGMKAFLGLYHEEVTNGKDIQNDIIRKTAATIAMSHHEKWDGSGYPNRLAGEDIPLAGRIVALADVYDALRTRRPYKNSFSREKACEIVVSSSETHFDPKLVEIFMDTLDQFTAIRKTFSDGYGLNK